MCEQQRFAFIKKSVVEDHYFCAKADLKKSCRDWFKRFKNSNFNVNDKVDQDFKLNDRKSYTRKSKYLRKYYRK